MAHGGLTYDVFFVTCENLFKHPKYSMFLSKPKIYGNIEGSHPNTIK